MWQPLESIPVSCRGWAETKAAYRFFDNDKVTGDKILAPHRRATFERMEVHPTVFLIQDTTHLNYSTQYQRKDIGLVWTTKETMPNLGPQRYCVWP